MKRYGKTISHFPKHINESEQRTSKPQENVLKNLRRKKKENKTIIGFGGIEKYY